MHLVEGAFWHLLYDLNVDATHKNEKNKLSNEKYVESTTSQFTMSDVISYANSENRLIFSTDIKE